MTTLDSSKEIKKNDIEASEHHEDFRMFGLITFLIADGMTFAGFFAAYLTYKAVNPLPDGAIYELELPIPTLNTILLLVSSATFHKAGKALLKNKNSDTQKWLLVTALLGITFLICQLFEYFNLPFGLTDNLFASTFYALTGFHGLHVTLGTLMILIISWQTRPKEGRITNQNMFPLEAVELYWHFVDGIWVILFIILYLL
ncbi:Cytochrome c oxidase, subunit III [Prochlorococcus marinus subsp. pastoris str. CCMP1986]|jgi:cytochrome c oxidase subunit 3|uniref:Oxidase aa(3) subunit 3 n=1 Tax=Prochlorococcus marinus subsp. pastoris (strain CCMP1986 / NIES-2087 / MED4) TaxID=59919 RepID=Q7V2N1_PROMP|nr:heme-copper oxidase subunit III [Prochlorococcus marinus]KGF86207.1 Cytochrome c oxidase polypeptide III [Prochlorococcus marinus str. EQPAC1]CAE18903.1 Cytochrome c oxidase, subunit III [Prochlorococcus marinus subsp. pastoris str. CCMP1986]